MSQDRTSLWQKIRTLVQLDLGRNEPSPMTPPQRQVIRGRHRKPSKRRAAAVAIGVGSLADLSGQGTYHLMQSMVQAQEHGQTMASLWDTASTDLRQGFRQLPSDSSQPKYGQS